MDFKVQISKLPKNWIVLVSTSAKDYMGVNAKILKYLLSKNASGIYVTINKPASSVRSYLVKNKVPVSRMYFVDCVSRLMNADTEKAEGVIFVHPQNLTGIALAINEMISAIKGEKFLFFDSLSTLLIYNNVGSVEKFSHFITNKIRLLNLRGVILTLEDDMDPKFATLLNKVCDKVIRAR